MDVYFIGVAPRAAPRAEDIVQEENITGTRYATFLNNYKEPPYNYEDRPAHNAANTMVAARLAYELLSDKNEGWQDEINACMRVMYESFCSFMLQMRNVKETSPTLADCLHEPLATYIDEILDNCVGSTVRELASIGIDRSLRPRASQIGIGAGRNNTQQGSDSSSWQGGQGGQRALPPARGPVSRIEYHVEEVGPDDSASQIGGSQFGGTQRGPGSQFGGGPDSQCQGYNNQNQWGGSQMRGSQMSGYQGSQRPSGSGQYGGGDQYGGNAGPSRSGGGGGGDGGCSAGPSGDNGLGWKKVPGATFSMDDFLPPN
jgi:hypothetical protein